MPDAVAAVKFGIAVAIDLLTEAGYTEAEARAVIAALAKTQTWPAPAPQTRLKL